MAQANIAPTASRNLWAAVTRAAAIVWNGIPTDTTEIPPIAPNNEAIRSVNNAGSAYVNILKVNTSDQVEIVTAAVASAGFSVSGGSFTPSGGIAPYGAGYSWFWCLGYVPNAATTGTSSAGVASQQWVGAVFIPTNMTVTGISYLVGTTGGTDKAIAALYDSAGNLLANSTTTGSGTTVGTAATMQALAFTSAYNAKGPGLYYMSIQTNGNAAFLRTVPVGVGFCSKTNTATSAAPMATIVVPTSFTADAAVVASLY